MIKALMIITMVSGAEYTAQLPSMDECAKQKEAVVSQNDVASAACIPRTEKSNSFDKMKMMMSMFKQVIEDLETRHNKKCGPWGDPERDGFHWTPSELCGK